MDNAIFFHRQFCHTSICFFNYPKTNNLFNFKALFQQLMFLYNGHEIPYYISQGTSPIDLIFLMDIIQQKMNLAKCAIMSGFHKSGHIFMHM